MSNLETYNKAFCEALTLQPNELNDDLAFNAIPAWDSVGHMMLVAALEAEFGIELAPDDIVGFDSYKAGKRILQDQYKIEF